jgi:hypothetical protein
MVSLLLGLLLTCSVTVVNAAGDVQYGQFEVTYTAAELLDQETIESVSEFMDVNEDVVWSMYVPESYDPDIPAGLMVYISPSDSGWTPKGWRTVLDDENLIWISANASGNEVMVAKRMIYAVLAPQIAAAAYKIDTDRVYLSGFSGGGKVSGMVAIDFANLFRGAIYICGAENRIDEASELISQVKKNRYVFLTGSEDFNRDLTYKIHRRYETAGVPNIELIKVPRMSHSNPNTLYFRKAVNYLDQRE